MDNHEWVNNVPTRVDHGWDFTSSASVLICGYHFFKAFSTSLTYSLEYVYAEDVFYMVLNLSFPPIKNHSKSSIFYVLTGIEIHSIKELKKTKKNSETLSELWYFSHQEPYFWRSDLICMWTSQVGNADRSVMSQQNIAPCIAIVEHF